MSASESPGQNADIRPIHQDAHYGPLANAVRMLSMDAVAAAKSGHSGLPLGMADAATVLFAEHMNFDPADPNWPDRDRFVLSAGHGSMLLYSILHLTGYPGVTLDEIKRFRQLGSRTPGHPEHGHTPGVETTTGPLGQGLANSVGMALAERILNARFGDDLVSHFTYVIAGDGCLMEGISHEAISLAGHLGLGRLIVLWDNNSISIDGPTDLAVSDDQPRRFAAADWHVQQVDGHDPHAVSLAIAAAKKVTDQPSLICCHTIIGYGAPTKAGTATAHGALTDPKEVAGTRERLHWPYPAYEIPNAISAEWLKFPDRGRAAHAAWLQRMAKSPKRAEFDAAIGGELPEAAVMAAQEIARKFAAEKPKTATRQASGHVLDAIAPHAALLTGGSADLTGSNNTKAAGQKPVVAGDFDGSYIHYGVREHGMAAAMSGIALHRGLIPYGGTFLVFADYARPAIRLASLMGIRVIYVMTHDSIGVGEDGPTHQPVETLASLRAIPHLTVLRPADPVEVAECWQIALANRHGPTVLALSRQAIPTLRDGAEENLSARGGYVLAEASGPRKATLLATGTEVSVAVAARDKLEAAGIPTAVVSIPSFELFRQQDAAYRDTVLGLSEIRVAVEAAVDFGWAEWLGPKGKFIGMTGFGASAPAELLYAHFGITPDAVAEAVKGAL